jgi:V/A-type H+-transporting ATPase subunit F
MKSFLLCASRDTLLSFRLTGVEGILVDNNEMLRKELSLLIKNADIGIIMISEDVLTMDKDYVMGLKLSLKNKLIIQIPEPNGIKDNDYIMRYIKESIGISI